MLIRFEFSMGVWRAQINCDSDSSSLPAGIHSDERWYVPGHCIHLISFLSGAVLNWFRIFGDVQVWHTCREQLKRLILLLAYDFVCCGQYLRHSIWYDFPQFFSQHEITSPADSKQTKHKFSWDTVQISHWNLETFSSTLLMISILLVPILTSLVSLFNFLLRIALYSAVLSCFSKQSLWKYPLHLPAHFIMIPLSRQYWHTGFFCKPSKMKFLGYFFKQKLSSFFSISSCFSVLLFSFDGFSDNFRWDLRVSFSFFDVSAIWYNFWRNLPRNFRWALWLGVTLLFLFAKGLLLLDAIARPWRCVCSAICECFWSDRIW